LVEASHDDVWLLRLEGDDKSRLLTISRVFRVDVRSARHILEHLPRLVARDLAPSEARKLAQRLREMGGLVHVCGTGTSPDFGALLAAPARAPAARPTHTRKRSHADDAAVAAARVANDSALAHFPEETGPYVWEPDPDLRPPLLPKPVRHSATRVAVTLVVALVAISGGGALYWQHYGRELLRVSIAKPTTAAAVPHRPPSAAPDGPARIALADECAIRAKSDAFKAIVAQVEKTLGRQATPLLVLGREVGVGFELRETELREKLETLHADVTTASALLLRHAKQIRLGFDEAALLPLADPVAAVQLVGTAGNGISTKEIATWLRALRGKRALRLLGAGEHFIEGRFETPERAESEDDAKLDACPGPTTRSGGGVEGDAIGSIERSHRGERFACTWP